LRHRGFRHRVVEAAAPMADVEDHTTLLGLNIAKMSPGASCKDFAVKAHFRRS
jgi:hypothetical protein